MKTDGRGVGKGRREDKRGKAAGVKGSRDERPQFGREAGKTVQSGKTPFWANRPVTGGKRSGDARRPNREAGGESTSFPRKRRDDQRRPFDREERRQAGAPKSPFRSSSPFAGKPRRSERADEREHAGEGGMQPRFRADSRRREERPVRAERPRSERPFRTDRVARPERRDRSQTEARPRQSPRAEKPRSPIQRPAPPVPQVRAEAGTIVVNRRAAERLRSGNPWAYRSDVISAAGIAPGSMAPVEDERGKSIGTALYSSSSQIALRMVSNERLESDEELIALVRHRLQSAMHYRNRVVEGSDGYRVVFSEADLLPGVIVDRYNDVLSMQILTQAMDRNGVRDTLIEALVEHFHPAGIVERIDARIRELEELPPRESGLVWGDKSATTFNMNGLTFHFDGLAGQKTGAFLDQRENYLAAAKYARGEALDVFCYQGGFALHLARACERVTGVDSSRPALETAEQNLAANSDELRSHQGGAEVEWIEANAFDLLRDYADAGRQYDTIVLDPPAFAKSKKALDTAIRGYKELNLRGLKMVRPGGTFVTCSCSHHVSESDFLNMLADAAADAHRTVRIVEKRTQAKDHPILLSMPETQYLKCVVAFVE